MKLQKQQLDEAVALLERAHEHDPNATTFAKRKVRFLMEDAINNPKYLVLVNKDITAILIWQITPTFFSYKKMISEVVFFSESAGSGFRLLKESTDWLEAWGDSVESICLGTSSEDERVDEMIQRFGYKKVGSQFIKGDR